MAKVKEVGIKKVVIQMGDKEVPLTVEDAKKLHVVLDELFGKEVPYPTFPSYPTYPSYPNWYPWRWQDNVVYCNDNSSTLHFTETTNTAFCCID